MRRARRQRSIWCRFMVRAGVLALLLSSGAFSSGLPAKLVKDRNLYCVEAKPGEWAVQVYPPLIDLAHGTRFVQASYEGDWLEVVRVREDNASYGLVFEYKFDRAGKLAALHGLVRRWGRWDGEADLVPQADGTVKRPWVRYSSGGGQTMVEPDDGPRYAEKLMQVKVYRNVQEIPCAGLLRETEKKNATQE